MIPLPLLHRGKVRDVYEVPEPAVGGAAQPLHRRRARASDFDPRQHRRSGAGSSRRGDAVPAPLLLLVASDRLSAFAVVMREAVPGKGRVLTQMTAWWLDRHLPDIPHHTVSVRADEIARIVPALAGCEDEWAGRATLVRRTRPLPVECVVRGYLSGSAWKECRESGTLAGEPLPPGLVESGKLPAPIFSPATKAQVGHDENITFAAAQEVVGADLARRLRERSLAIFERASEVAARGGIILADTKFEFGISPEGELLLIDEVLTPDSSRFWPRESYRAGRPQPSLDKQPLRDFLDGLADWDKRPPPPPLPRRVVDAVGERYRGVFERLTGIALEAYDPPRFGRVGGGPSPGASRERGTRASVGGQAVGERPPASVPGASRERGTRASVRRQAAGERPPASVPGDEAHGPDARPSRRDRLP